MKVELDQTLVDALWMACRVDIGSISGEPYGLKGKAQLKLQRLREIGAVKYNIGDERPVANEDVVEETQV